MGKSLIAAALFSMSFNATAQTFQTISHDKYPITVHIPEHWSAQTGYDSIRPCDTWTLMPKAANMSDSASPFIVILIGPSGSRTSAFFPGGLDPNGQKTTLKIGQQLRHATREGNQYVKADFNEENLSIGIHARARSEADQAVVKTILSSLSFSALDKEHNKPLQRTAEDGDR